MKKMFKSMVAIAAVSVFTLAAASASASQEFVEVNHSQVQNSQLSHQGGGFGVTAGIVRDNGVLHTLNIKNVDYNRMNTADGSTKVNNKFFTTGLGYQYTYESFAFYGQGLYGYGRLHESITGDHAKQFVKAGTQVYGGELGVVYSFNDDIALDASMSRLYADFQPRSHIDLVTVGVRYKF